MTEKYRTKEQIEEDVANIPVETKQKVLDLLRNGMKVGDIRKELNLDLMDTAEIITQNIGCYHYLKTVAE